MIYALIALTTLFVVVWYDLFVRDAGVGQERRWPTMPEGRTLKIRLRGGSIYAKLLNIGKQFGGLSIRRTIHATGQLTRSRLSHEVFHVLHTAEIGTYRYLWLYLTSAKFREQEEADAEAYNAAHAHDPVIVNALAKWGGR